MSSKPFKIFGQSRGIDVSQAPQGRNVQPIMVNKKFQSSTQKQIQAPFDGYISTAYTQNNLSISQASDINNELKKAIKQQLSKINLSNISNIRNELDLMKVQILNLKQNALRTNTQIKKQSDKNNDQITKQLQKRFQLFQIQTFKKIRQFITKMDQSLKKHCQTKFLSRQFLNDFHQISKLISSFSDRIQVLQGHKYQNKKQQQPIIIAQTFNLHIKQIQRQIQFTKKIINQIHPKINQINDTFTSLKSKHIQDYQQSTKQISSIKKQISQTQKQLNNINKSLNQLRQQNKQSYQKLLTLQQIQNRSPPPKWVIQQQSDHGSAIKQFTTNQKVISLPGAIDKLAREVSDEDTSNKKKLFQSPQKHQHQNSNQKGAPIEKIDLLNNSQEKGEQALFYQIDKNNFLLDEQGNYILNENGKEVQLSDDQLAILRKSTIVKLSE